MLRFSKFAFLLILSYRSIHTYIINNIIIMYFKQQHTDSYQINNLLLKLKMFLLY